MCPQVYSTQFGTLSIQTTHSSRSGTGSRLRLLALWSGAVSDLLGPAVFAVFAEPCGRGGTGGLGRLVTCGEPLLTVAAAELHVAEAVAGLLSRIVADVKGVGMPALCNANKLPCCINKFAKITSLDSEEGLLVDAFIAGIPIYNINQGYGTKINIFMYLFYNP